MGPGAGLGGVGRKGGAKAPACARVLRAAQLLGRPHTALVLDTGTHMVEVWPSVELCLYSTFSRALQADPTTSPPSRHASPPIPSALVPFLDRWGRCGPVLSLVPFHDKAWACLPF